MWKYGLRLTTTASWRPLISVHNVVLVAQENLRLGIEIVIFKNGKLRRGNPSIGLNKEIVYVCNDRFKSPVLQPHTVGVNI